MTLYTPDERSGWWKFGTPQDLRDLVKTRTMVLAAADGFLTKEFEEKKIMLAEKSCTTIGNLLFKEKGVLWAACFNDGQSTGDGVRAEIDVKKTNAIDFLTLMSGTGYSIGCEYWKRVFAAYLETHECLNDGKLMSVNAKLNIIADVVLQLFQAGDTLYFFIPVVAAFDTLARPPRARIFDVWGQVKESQDFCVNGSGSLLAGPYLRGKWRRYVETGMTRRAAIRMAVGACHAAGCVHTANTVTSVNDAKNIELLGPDGIEVIPYAEISRVLEEEVRPLCDGCQAELKKGGGRHVATRTRKRDVHGS